MIFPQIIARPPHAILALLQMRIGDANAAIIPLELRAKRDQMAAQLAELEAGPRKEEIEAAKNDWEALVAELDQARVDAKRSEDLLAELQRLRGSVYLQEGAIGRHDLIDGRHQLDADAKSQPVHRGAEQRHQARCLLHRRAGP